MENASRALIMAGSMLIAIAILSTFVYVFREGSRVAASYDEKQSKLTLAKYNAQYEAYIKEWSNIVEVKNKNETDDGKSVEVEYKEVPYYTNNSIYDIISVINLAYTSNKDFDYDGQNTVTIKVIDQSGKTIFQLLDDKSKGLKSNQVLLGTTNTKAYIYNLAEMKFKDLNLTANGVSGDDKLSYSELRYDSSSNKMYTWYKYLFYCKDVKYNAYGRIVGMTFEIRNNHT